MKVVHILYSGLGGHGSVFFSLIRAPSERNIEHVPIFFGIEPLRDEYRQICTDIGVDYRFVHKAGKSQHLAQLELWRAIRSLNPDAIFAHSGASLPAAWLFCVARPTKYLALVEHQPNHQKTLHDWVASCLAPRVCGGVVYLSDSSRDEIAGKLGFLFSRSGGVTIPNGIDVDYFSPGQYKGESSTGELTVGMAARMNELKDHRTLIDAAEIAFAESRPFRVKLAGDGPLRDELQSLVENVGLTSHVDFLGMLDESSLRDFYRGLDLYVHATLGETMSTSIMQAQACGLPVIASDVKGVNTHLTHGFDGLLVPARNGRMLEEAIYSLSSNLRLAAELGGHARSTATRKFSSSTMRRHYENIARPRVARAKCP